MNMRLAKSLYLTFVVSRWTYGGFLQSFTQKTASRLDAVDAAFISSVLVACRTSGTRGRRLMLPTMRALLRLPSPALGRKILANRYTARLHRNTDDNSVPGLGRTRARTALRALPQVPTHPVLVPDTAHPWGSVQEKAAQEEEWRNAGLRTKRPLPLPREGSLYSTVRLRDAWARALAARYHCAPFPILHRPDRLRGKARGDQTVARSHRCMNAHCSHPKRRKHSQILACFSTRNTRRRSSRQSLRP